MDLYNSHLANEFGNLISRTLHLVDKLQIAYPEDVDISCNYDMLEGNENKKLIDGHVNNIQGLWESFSFNEALSETNSVVKFGNKLINDEEPWKKGKDGWKTLLEVHYLLSCVADLYEPVIPDKIKEVKKALKNNKKVILFEKIIVNE